MEFEMIRVDLGEEVPQLNKASKWHWTVPMLGLEGLSREPLLDACRAVKRTGGPFRTTATIGLYRPGEERPVLFCSVGVGAATTVLENEKKGPRFVKWRKFPNRR